MRPDDLPRHLSKGLAGLYTLHGDETLLVLEAAQQIRDAARAAGYAEREVLTVEPGFAWSELEMQGNSFSLFSDKKLIELRISTGKPGIDGGKAIEAYCQRLPPDTITLVTCPRLDKTGQNSKWFQALAAKGEVLEAKNIEHRQLPEWIAGRLARQQQKLSPEALQFLADRVEGNLLAAFQEIQKLALLHPEGEISVSDLQASVANVARYDVFQLGAALLTGDATRFARMLAGLRAEGEAPHLVLWSLAEEIRTLYRLGLGKQRGTPTAQLFKELRIWGEKQKLVEPALARVKAAQLKTALAHAALIDQMNKGIGKGEVWDELMVMCLPLLRKK
ncbi:DNA polymerase III subunit delta [Iodobacter fluviatilis]|uniref:DNA polymerase III subunit delta n=1 Tax=Iodobacter fluviatilis TaxID=537 RepID=A0A377SY99_9NEIS|nr:DNA polymerase III subunit delta [Iodobacter fluviatilis]TCU85020.1 DNA polymerase III delta subunit [Iodobacter fluviatilis]STR45296.1 DNA polymerase III subunit delta [Iodobacter fluviatilis]